MSTLAPGVRLNDRFTLRAVIGTGGMAEVWRADDAVLGRPVAVKVLTAVLAGDPSFRTATYNEARAAARLAHPHVTQIHDYGETTLPDGTVLPYLVMELVDGESLADRLQSGPLPWQQSLAVASQVASALAAAHALGIVHHDIKPANVVLTSAGTKVVDFGIAAQVGKAAGPDGGRLMGTPAYVAPERLRSSRATPASDVYALGVLLYEALTGRTPIAAADWGQAAAAHEAAAPIPPPDVPGLPDQVRSLCMACLAADPAQRPTAADLAHQLAAAAGPSAVAPEGAATMARDWMTNDPTPTLVVGSPAKFAVGAARLPHPPTMIESWSPAPGIRPRRRRVRAPLLATALVGLAVVALILAGVLSSGGANNTGSPPATGSSAPANNTPSPTPTPTQPTTAATTPQGIVDELNTAIDNAVAAGTMDSDAADSLRGRVSDLQDSISNDGNHDGNGGGRHGKLRDRASAVQSSIEQLASDGQIDQQTAAELTAIIEPLTNAG